MITAAGFLAWAGAARGGFVAAVAAGVGGFAGLSSGVARGVVPFCAFEAGGGANISLAGDGPGAITSPRVR